MQSFRGIRELGTERDKLLLYRVTKNNGNTHISQKCVLEQMRFWEKLRGDLENFLKGSNFQLGLIEVYFCFSNTTIVCF